MKFMYSSFQCSLLSLVSFLTLRRTRKFIQPPWYKGRVASYPDVSLSMKMCAQKKAGRRQRARRRFACRLYPSHGPLRFITNRSQLPVRNIPKFKDRANWSRDTFQPMRRRPCVYQQTNQYIAPVIKNFQNNGRSRTVSVIVSGLSGIFLRLFMGHTQFF